MIIDHHHISNPHHDYDHISHCSYFDHADLKKSTAEYHPLPLIAPLTITAKQGFKCMTYEVNLSIVGHTKMEENRQTESNRKYGLKKMIYKSVRLLLRYVMF